MAGPNPIEWPDLEAFCRLTGMRLAPWEISIIERLDDCFLKVQVSDETDSMALKESLKDAGKRRQGD